MKKLLFSRVFGFLVLAVAVLSVGARAEGVDSIDAAAKVAGSWLALVDNGQYAGSWVQAAKLLKSQVSQPQWEAAVKSARDAVGAEQTRVRYTANFARSLPGAPDGEYVVLTYNVAYVHKQAAVETLTLMREPDGAWRVAGYFLR